MTLRDRIIEFRRVPAGDLQANPRNWRTHSQEQRAALAGVLEEIGYASALLARRRGDGQLELIDGHLRAATTPDQIVPVLVLDVNEAEADKLLATFDPLTAMAGKNERKLRSLLRRVDTADPAVQAIFDSLEEDVARDEATSSSAREEVEIESTYQVLIECRDEVQQQEVYEELTEAGLDCRLMML